MIVATTTVNFAYLSGVWLETYERFKAGLNNEFSAGYGVSITLTKEM